MDKVSSRQNVKWTKCQVGKMLNEQNVIWTKCQIDKMTQRLNIKLMKLILNLRSLTKCQLGEMITDIISNGQYGKWSKCQMEEKLIGQRI